MVEHPCPEGAEGLVRTTEDRRVVLHQCTAPLEHRTLCGHHLGHVVVHLERPAQGRQGHPYAGQVAEQRRGEGGPGVSSDIVARSLGPAITESSRARSSTLRAIGPPTAVSSQAFVEGQGGTGSPLDPPADRVRS